MTEQQNTPQQSGDVAATIAQLAEQTRQAVERELVTTLIADENGVLRPQAQ